MPENSKFKVYIQDKAYQKFRYYIELCEDEISGFGRVQKIDGKLTIVDFQIFKQTVSSAHSDMDDDALAAFLFEKTKAKESLAEWRVWWHSHAAMATFFSGTDTNTINTSKEFPWLISIVGNHAGDIEARIDVYEPIRWTEELKVEVIKTDDPALKESCLKEIKEKVKRGRDTVFFSNYQTKKEKKEHSKGVTRFYGEDGQLMDEDEVEERMRHFYEH